MTASLEQVWQILNRQRRHLESIARRLGMSSEEAQDVVSEVIVRIAQRSDLDVSAVVGLAVTAVRGVGIDELRRKGRERRALARMADHLTHDSPELNACSVAVVQAILAQCAGMLTKAEFNVLCLVVDEEPHAVIAERLGITVRASEVALSRARGKLRGAAGVLVGHSRAKSRQVTVASCERVSSVSADGG